LSNPTKGWGAKCIPIAYYRLIRGYWRNNVRQAQADQECNPPNMVHQHFSLYYNFASVISSMISGGNEAVNPNNFTNVFSERVPQFENEQRKYL
jgi:hypothetical protein